MTYTDVFTQLVRTEIDMWSSLDHHVKVTTALSLANFQALAALARLPEPVRVQDIALEMRITVGAASKLVDRLEREGFARRAANLADRRSSVILLTEVGQRSYSAAATAVEAHLRGVFESSYSPSQASALASQLAALQAIVQDAAE